MPIKDVGIPPTQDKMSILDFCKCRKTFAIYTAVVYIILASLITYYNPYSIVTKYYGLCVFLFVFFASFIFAMIVWYDHAALYFTTMDIDKYTISPVWKLFKQSLFVLVSFTISGFILYWFMNGLIKINNTNSVISAIITLCISLSVLAMLYQLLLKVPFIKNSPFFRLIVNSLLYIPCIFVQIIDSIVRVYSIEKRRTNLTEVILLVITVILIVVYYLIPVVSNLVVLQGGKQLIDQPIEINYQKNIASYMELNNISPNIPVDELDFDYSYGLSCWIFLDSTTSSYYDKYSSILTYGGKPNIMYKASTNTLLITQKLDDDNGSQNILLTKITNNSLNTGQEVDDSGNLILYKKENMPLQKWNNIILNYSNGTLDVFFNGELVKSTMNVIPYMRLDTLTVGTTNGAPGGICNLVYYKNKLTSSQIYYMYNSVKNKKPPTLYSMRPTL